MIDNPLFYVNTDIVYPPFKNGLYLEEYFLKYYTSSNSHSLSIKSRKYIPALWTNFQIEPWFNDKIPEMQKALDLYIQMNPSKYGYFTVVQHDDGPRLKLPENTIIYGCCTGNIPLPLIYQDLNNTLNNIQFKSFSEKQI